MLSFNPGSLSPRPQPPRDPERAQRPPISPSPSSCPATALPMLHCKAHPNPRSLVWLPRRAPSAVPPCPESSPSPSAILATQVPPLGRLFGRGSIPFLPESRNTSLPSFNEFVSPFLTMEPPHPSPFCVGEFSPRVPAPSFPWRPSSLTESKFK